MTKQDPTPYRPTHETKRRIGFLKVAQDRFISAVHPELRYYFVRDNGMWSLTKHGIKRYEKLVKEGEISPPDLSTGTGL